MEGQAVGLLGMSEEEYKNATLRTLFNAIAAYSELEDLRQRHEWERIRWQTTALINIQLQKKDRLTTTKLLPLPWDGENEVGKEEAKPMTYQEQEAAFAKIDAYMKRRKEEKQAKKAALNGNR